ARGVACWGKSPRGARRRSPPCARASPGRSGGAAWRWRRRRFSARPWAEGYTRPLAMSTKWVLSPGERVLSTGDHPRKEPSMPLFSFEGKSPRVHPPAFIAPTACLIGDITGEEDASVCHTAVSRPPPCLSGDSPGEENGSVWYNALVRADFPPIIIRRGANVQDCSVIHVTPAGGSDVGACATVGHLCLVHAATLGEECLVGHSLTGR